MAFVQTAIVKIAENNKRVYTAQSIVKRPADEGKTLLDAAINYIKHNQKDFRPGESFEIYYRCEEIKDERNH